MLRLDWTPIIWQQIDPCIHAELPLEKLVFNTEVAPEIKPKSN